MELRNKDCTNKNTLNDPCPTGWRVISRDELGTLVDNTTHSYTGNAATSSIGSAAAVLTSKFNTSVKVTLPFTGFRDGADGRFSHASGTTLIDGNYWSADHVDDIGRLFTLLPQQDLVSGLLLTLLIHGQCQYVAWQNIHTNLIKPEKNLFNH